MAGDVYVIPWAKNKENNEGQARWLIIIEDLREHFLFVPMTKQIHQEVHNPNSFIVIKDSPDGRQMGLDYTSLVKPMHASKIPQLTFQYPAYGVHKKGTCPEEIMIRIEEALKPQF